MTDTEVFEKKENMSLESYSFTYTKEEFREAKKLYFKHPTIRVVVFNIFIIALVAYILISGEYDFLGGLVFGIEAMALYFSLNGLLLAKKSWNLVEPKVCSSVYTYELFEGYLFMKITREGETVHLTKFEYSDLRQKIDVGKYYLININNQIYIIKKQDLSENSLFHSLKPKAPEKPSATIRSLSKALFVLSIVSGVSGVLFIGSNMFNYGAKEWWYLLAFGTVPLASFIFGFYMKKYGGGRGNVIAGLLAFAFILGMFSAGYNDEPEIAGEYAKIEAVESYIDVDLPEPYSYENFKDSVNGITYEDTAMQFYGSEVQYLENVIKSSDDWSADFTDDTYELVKDIGTAEDWDYFTVYNITNEEYNTVPSEDGTYRMAAVYYNMDYHGMYVIEYTYTK